MLFISLTVLVAAHFLCGSGLLRLFRIKMTLSKHIALSMLTGIVILSFVPFILQLLYIPITFASVATGIAIVCLLMNLQFLKQVRKFSFSAPKISFFPSFKLYEWPFVLFLSFALLTSIWRSYYFPPNARDMLSGPEVIAEYTVKEQTMINSVFTVDLSTTNNHHKPPFVADLQVIYKLFGFSFGQVWVSLVGIFFVVFLFHLLRERIHPVIGGVLMLLFVAIPEIFAYTYVMLFDYSNMAFFFLAFYFLNEYFGSGEKKNFYFSAVLFAFATFIRLETLVLTAMILPAFWFYAFRKKLSLRNVAVQSGVLVLLPFVVYFLWTNVYMRYYMPAQFSLGEQINSNLSDLTPLFKRFKEMNTQLIFRKEYSLPLWGHFITVFIVMAIAELLVVRKLSRETLNWYYAIAVVYFGLPLLGYVLPLMDLFNTTKRGLFKLMPFMLLIMANNGILQRLSATINKWQLKPEENKKPVKQSASTGKAKNRIR